MGAARSSMACIGLLIAAIMGCSVVVDAAKPAHGHRHEHLRNHVNRVLAHAEATAPTTGSTTHFFTDAVLDHYSYRFGSLSGGSSNLRWKQRFYVNDKYWKGDGAPVFLYIGGEGPQGAPSDALPVMILQHFFSIVNALLCCFSQPRPGFSFPRVAFANP